MNSNNTVTPWNCWEQLFLKYPYFTLNVIELVFIYLFLHSNFSYFIIYEYEGLKNSVFWHVKLIKFENWITFVHFKGSSYQLWEPLYNTYVMSQFYAYILLKQNTLSNWIVIKNICKFSRGWFLTNAHLEYF